MPTTEEDLLFDAQLKAALSDPHRRHTVSPIQRDRPRAPVVRSRSPLLVGTTVIAASVVLTGLWVLSTRPAVTTPPPQDGRIATPQDKPKPDQRNPSRPERILQSLIARLHDPKTRPDAQRNLVLRGAPAARALAAALGELELSDTDQLTGVLGTLERLGATGAVALPALEARLAACWPRTSLPLLETLAELAVWGPTTFPHGRVQLPLLERTADRDRFLLAVARVRARATVFGTTEAAAIVTHLRHVRAERREAALDLLVTWPRLAPPVGTAVEAILLRNQTSKRIPVDTLRRKAADLLIAKAPGEPCAATAFAWRLSRPTYSNRARSTAALSAGAALATARARTPARTQYTLRALLAALQGEDLTVAGEAATGLSFMGEVALPALPILEQRAQHTHQGLSKRAAAAVKVLHRIASKRTGRR